MAAVKTLSLSDVCCFDILKKKYKIFSLIAKMLFSPRASGWKFEARSLLAIVCAQSPLEAQMAVPVLGLSTSFLDNEGA